MSHERDSDLTGSILLVARELCGIRGQIEQHNKTNSILKRLEEMEKRIMMNAQQLEALLNNQTTQIGKIAKEQSDRFDALVAANKVLQDLIDAGGVTPAIEAAAGKVQEALDSLDVSIPDAPPV